MGTPYNPERDPDGLYARPRLEDQARIVRAVSSRPCRAEAPGEGGSAPKTRPADDFAWNDFLKSIRETTDASAARNPVLQSKP